MGDPNQGRYVVGCCLLDMINTLREGDNMRLGLLFNESLPEKPPRKGCLCILG